MMYFSRPFGDFSATAQRLEAFKFYSSYLLNDKNPVSYNHIDSF